MLRGFLRLFALLLKVGIPLGLIAWGAWLLLRRNAEHRGSSTSLPEKIEPPFRDPVAPSEEPREPEH